MNFWVCGGVRSGLERPGGRISASDNECYVNSPGWLRVKTASCGLSSVVVVSSATSLPGAGPSESDIVSSPPPQKDLTAGHQSIHLNARHHSGSQQNQTRSRNVSQSLDRSRNRSAKLSRSHGRERPQSRHSCGATSHRSKSSPRPAHHRLSAAEAGGRAERDRRCRRRSGGRLAANPRAASWHRNKRGAGATHTHAQQRKAGCGATHSRLRLIDGRRFGGANLSGLVSTKLGRTIR